MNRFVHQSISPFEFYQSYSLVIDCDRAQSDVCLENVEKGAFQ